MSAPGRRERVILPLAAQMSTGDASQLVVDGVDQPAARDVVALAPRQQQRRDFGPVDHGCAFIPHLSPEGGVRPPANERGVADIRPRDPPFIRVRPWMSPVFRHAPTRLTARNYAVALSTASRVLRETRCAVFQ
jgi:hypothetical protein